MDLKEPNYILTRDFTRTIRFWTDEHGTKGITDLRVCRSAAGYYIGRMCDDGPYSRDSEYYTTSKECEEDLKMLKDFK